MRGDVCLSGLHPSYYVLTLQAWVFTCRACQPLVQATNACLDGADLTCACNTETVSGFVTCATCAPVIYQGDSDSLRAAVERESGLLPLRRRRKLEAMHAMHAIFTLVLMYRFRPLLLATESRITEALQQCQAAGSPVDYDPSQVPAGSGSPAGQGGAINTDSLASNSVGDSPSSSSGSSSLTLIAPTAATSSDAILISPTTPTTLASSPAAGAGARPITSTASVPPVSSAAANGNATETAADNAGGAIAAIKLQGGLLAALVVAVSAALALVL